MFSHLTRILDRLPYELIHLISGYAYDPLVPYAGLFEKQTLETPPLQDLRGIVQPPSYQQFDVHSNVYILTPCTADAKNPKTTEITIPLIPFYWRSSQTKLHIFSIPPTLFEKIIEFTVDPILKHIIFITTKEVGYMIYPKGRRQPIHRPNLPKHPCGICFEAGVVYVAYTGTIIGYYYPIFSVACKIMVAGSLRMLHISGEHLYGINEQNQIAVVDLATYRLVSRIPTVSPQHYAVDNQGRVLVTEPDQLVIYDSCYASSTRSILQTLPLRAECGKAEVSMVFPYQPPRTNPLLVAVNKLGEVYIGL